MALAKNYSGSQNAKTGISILVEGEKMISILSCQCRHAYQDEKYGVFNRVHNYARKAFSGAGGWRCTVCLNIRQIPTAKSVSCKTPSESAAKASKKAARQKKSAPARPVRPAHQRIASR